MAEEASNIHEIKTTSDGTVQIAVEKYNEMLETIADQKGSISTLTEKLNRARNEPPVINRTVVNKTPEMLAKEYRMWGGSLMGLGASFLVVGALLYKAGRSQ